MACRKYAVILAGALLAGLALGAPTSTARASPTSTARAAPTSTAQGLAAMPTYASADVDSGKAMRDLSKLAYDTAMARAAKGTHGCTKDKVKIRKEW